MTPASPALAGAAATAGACTALWSGIWPTASLLATALAVAALAAAGVGVLWRLGRRCAPAFAVLAFALGFAASGWTAARVLAQQWPPSLADTRVVARAQIVSLVDREGGTLSFEAILEREAPARWSAPEPPSRLRARVTWSGAPTGVRAPRAGETWRLLLELDPPRARQVPGAVDMERQWFRTGLGALAKVRASPLNARLAHAAPGLLPLRERLAERLGALATDPDARALILALSIGATGEMSSDQWRVFSATGTTHLVAISGAHVTVFAWLTMLGASALWRRVARAGWPERDVVAGSCGLAAAAGYALLAGFSVPTQRTLVMFATWWLSRLLGRRTRAFDLLGHAAIAVLLLDPLAPLAAGFWLSFGAMGALLAVEDRVRAREAGRADGPAARVRARILEFTRTQGAVSLATLPLTLALFGSASIVGLAANAVAIPFFTLWLTPAVLLASALSVLWPAAAAAVLWVVERSWSLAWPVAEWLADLPGAVWQGAPDWPWYPLFAIALASLLLVPLPAWRAAACLCALPVFATARPAEPPGRFALQVLDVGDSLAVLVRTQGGALLFDTGEVYGSAGRATARGAVAALQAAGVARLDALVLSRADAIRIAGFGRVLQHGAVDAVWFGGDWPGRPAALRRCAEAAPWMRDGVRFELLATASRDECLLRLVDARGRSALIAPRLDDPDLATLRTLGRELRAEVLVAPRRGSVRAVTPALRAAVRPDYVLASRGRADERWFAQQLAAWRLPVARLWVTASDGTIVARVTERGAWRVESWRTAGPVPLWRASVRYDRASELLGVDGRCGRSCGPAVR